MEEKTSSDPFIFLKRMVGDFVQYSGSKLYIEKTWVSFPHRNRHFCVPETLFRVVIRNDTNGNLVWVEQEISMKGY